MFSVFRKSAWPEIPFEDIKKRARLLVIDDLEFPYEELFKRDGYTIEKWPDVLDLSKLESGAYDIILLDLQGVGRQQSAEQGLGVLRHLRQVAPSQVIIAYSSADWPIKYQEFFRLADEVLAKSSDYVDFKRTVDRLLQQRFSLGFYLSRVRTLVANYVEDNERLDGVVQQSIQRRSPEKLQQYLQGKVTDPQVINAAANVVRTAIAIVSLWKH
jgi:CheY-like chemotaxis protein